MATGSFRNAVDSYNMKHLGTTSPGMLPERGFKEGVKNIKESGGAIAMPSAPDWSKLITGTLGNDPAYDAIVKGYWDSKASSTTSTAGDHTADALTYEKLAEAIQKVTGVEPPKKAPTPPEFGSW